MTDKQLEQLRTVASVEAAITAHISSIRDLVGSLKLNAIPLVQDGDGEENNAHKQEMIAYLSRIVNNANTLLHPAVVIRATLSEVK